VSRIEEIVAKLGTPLAEELGYELVDVEYHKEGPNWVLRCAIDCQTGVGIDECQVFSEVFGKMLDKEDPIPGHYLLEVSSPGVERPLKKDLDFIRFTGRKAEITLHQPWHDQKIFRGVLMGIKENEIDRTTYVIITGDDIIVNGGHTIEIPRHMIKKARLLLEILNPRSRAKGGQKRK
jgi:ribosome maturation factor RimP